MTPGDALDMKREDNCQKSVALRVECPTTTIEREDTAQDHQNQGNDQGSASIGQARGTTNNHWKLEPRVICQHLHTLTELHTQLGN